MSSPAPSRWRCHENRLKRPNPRPRPWSTGAPELATAAPGISNGARRIVLWVFVVSGFATLALEVIWFRVIVLIARPTVYAFALMLASVLAGIAIGSAIATPFLRRGLNRIGVLAALEVALAFAVMVSLATLNYAQAVYDVVEPALAPLLEHRARVSAGGCGTGRVAREHSDGGRVPDRPATLGRRHGRIAHGEPGRTLLLRQRRRRDRRIARVRVRDVCRSSAAGGA